MIVSALAAAAIGQALDGALLIVIFATSGALEALATARTADSVRGLLDLASVTATRLLDDGSEESVATEVLAVGDTIVVRPGERVGADGRVLDGASEVDQATITGEPLPVAKQVGGEVFAGTLNGTGALRVKVERDACDSVIARIVAMVEEASESAGDLGRAIPLFDQILEETVRVLGKNHPDTLASRNNLACAHESAGAWAAPSPCTGRPWRTRCGYSARTIRRRGSWRPRPSGGGVRANLSHRNDPFPEEDRKRSSGVAERPDRFPEPVLTKSTREAGSGKCL
jgi:hypothetical protein